MDRASIKELLREVLGPNVELVDHPKWVGLRCPLAPWKHQTGRDSKPSAGVSVKEDDTSIYNCYVCGKGPISYLIKEWDKYTGENHSKLLREVEGNEVLGGSLPSWSSARVPRKVQVQWHDAAEYLSLYDSAVGHPYLAERGISDETAELLDLRVDPGDSRGAERILFPVMDVGNKLYGFSGRAVEEGVDPKVRDYHGLEKRNVLLGKHLVSDSDKYIVLCEGLVDYAAGRQAGEPFMATMHAGLTEEQLRIVLNIGKPVILFYDNDDAGNKATDEAIKKIGQYLPVRYVEYPVWRSKNGRPLAEQPKDPGGLADEEIAAAVKDAKIP